MVLYYNECRENGQNVKYPLKKEIGNLEDLKSVVCYDHTCAKCKDNYRKRENFISADCSMFDVDNERRPPEQWVNPDNVRKAFPDVPFYVVYSRHNMKPKGDEGPRPRFHIYFPDVPYTDVGEYTGLKIKVCKYFTAFDPQAKDATRFFFGVEQPKVEFYPGDTLLSDFMKNIPNQSSNGIEHTRHVANSRTGTISEGTRNNTMFRFAKHILREKGDTEGAHQAFMDESKKCSPQLSQEELKGIWKSARKRYHNGAQNSTDENGASFAWNLLDFTDQSALKVLFCPRTQRPKIQYNSCQAIFTSRRGQSASERNEQTNRNKRSSA